MAKTFASLKKNNSNRLSKLTESINKMGNKGFNDPFADTYWKLSRDKAGNGMAVIRFLPEPPGEETDPWVQIWEHFFKGPTGQWYTEKSLTTLGQPDPVSEYNSQLWNSTSDDGAPARKQARDQKRKLSYHSNILVVKDPANRENEGKVFRFSYGQQIFDMIKAKLTPEFEGDEPVDVFSLWEGANFKLKARLADGFVKYDRSEWEAPSAIPGTDEELEAIWNRCHSLTELTAPEQFKSYDQLKQRLYVVLGKVTSSIGTEGDRNEIRMEEDEIPAFDKPETKAPAVTQKTASVDDGSPSSTNPDDDEDDSMAFFQNLADNS